MQLQNVLECYNVTAEEDEDPRNIDIEKFEGYCEVNGPEIGIPDITKPLKAKKVNIGSGDEPKFATIGDYWDEDTNSKVIDLLHEYQGSFPIKFSDMKGIVGDLGFMKIPLKPDAKPVKKRPYRLNPK